MSSADKRRAHGGIGFIRSQTRAVIALLRNSTKSICISPTLVYTVMALEDDWQTNHTSGAHITSCCAARFHAGQSAYTVQFTVLERAGVSAVAGLVIDDRK